MKTDAPRVVVSAWVDAATAGELARRARDGDRSVSREAGRAIKQYLAEQAEERAEPELARNGR